MDKQQEQEQILNPLRELYRQDLDYRRTIAKYANNFKLRGVFLRREVNFLEERLAFLKINTERNLLPVKLLTVELVPSSCWFSNVRDRVPQKTWDFLRRLTYKEANYECEVCGGRGDKWPVECHEIWHYNDLNHIQTLSGLTALCPSCHQVKHIGLAGLQGYGESAEAHLAKINGYCSKQTDSYLETVWDTWQQRSCHDWSLELSWLDRYNIHIE